MELPQGSIDMHRGEEGRRVRPWLFGAASRVAWVYALFFPSHTFISTLEPVFVRLLLIVGSIIGALSLLVAQKRGRVSSAGSRPHLCAAVAAGLCFLILAGSSLFEIPVLLLMAAVLLAGVTTGIQTADWTCSYGAANSRVASVSSAGSNALGTALIVALFFLGSLCPALLFILACPMPILSHFACLSYRSHCDRESAGPEASQPGRVSNPCSRSLLARLLLGFSAYGASYGFTLGYLAFCTPGVGGVVNITYAALTLAAAVGLGILAAAMFMLKEFSLRRLYAPVFPLFIAGMLFFLLVPASAADAALFPTNLGYFMLVVLADVALPMASFVCGRDVRTVAPLGWCCLSIGFLGGSLVQVLVDALGIGGTALSALVMCLVLAMVLADRFLLAPAIAKISDTAMEPGFETESAPTGAEGFNSSEASVLDTMAADYGLTPREREVLSLLAHGRDAKHVQTELGVSIYTARTHIRRIYEKLAVHSKQELIDLIEQRARA